MFVKPLALGLAVTANIALRATVKEHLGGRSGHSLRKGFLPASTAPRTLQISELHIPRSIQAVKADGTGIEDQAGACRAGFHNLMPAGKERIPPTSARAGKGEDGGRTGQLCLHPTLSWGHGEVPTLQLT